MHLEMEESVSEKCFDELGHLGALDGHWRVLGGRPQGAGIRDRGGGGDTEARTFSHEWTAGCEGAEEEQREALGKAARGGALA